MGIDPNKAAEFAEDEKDVKAVIRHNKKVAGKSKPKAKAKAKAKPQKQKAPKAPKEKKPRELKKKTCPECGGEYTGKRKTCSAACAKERSVKASREAADQMRNKKGPIYDRWLASIVGQAKK